MDFVMRQSAGQSLEQSLQLSQRLSQRQRQAVAQAQLQHQRDLVEALHGYKFTPRANCPCGHQLTDLEIVKGFRDDPTDYTTKCPKCEQRFLPKLHYAWAHGSMDVAFYCPTQTLDLLPGLVTVPLESLRREHTAVYYSAVAHFGGLKQAFARLGLTYVHEADLDWKNRIGSFIGKMPDAAIARFVGASAREIRKLRRERGIPAYSRRLEAENLAP